MSSDSLRLSENWQYQWSEVIPFDAADLTKHPEDMFGENVFWRFIPLAETDIKDKIIFVACGGRGREVFHISKRSPSKIIVNEIGTEVYAIKRSAPVVERPIAPPAKRSVLQSPQTRGRGR